MSGTFGPPLGPFGLLLPPLGLPLASLGRLLGLSSRHLGLLLGSLEPLLAPSWLPLALLGPTWALLRVHLASFGAFGPPMAPFGRPFGHFWSHFGSIWTSRWTIVESFGAVPSLKLVAPLMLGQLPRSDLRRLGNSLAQTLSGPRRSGNSLAQIVDAWATPLLRPFASSSFGQYSLAQILAEFLTFFPVCWL